MRGLRRALLKVLVLVPLGLIASFVAIGPGQFVSYTPATRLGVHSMIAFWVAIPASLGVLYFQKQHARMGALILSALLFPMIVHIGSAIRSLFQLPDEVIVRPPIDFASDVFELSMIALLFLGVIICMIRVRPGETPSRATTSFLVLVVFLPFVAFGVAWFIILPLLAPTQLNTAQLILGAIAVVAFSAVLIISIKFRNQNAPIDLGYFISTILLFIASVIALIHPSLLWELSETLQMAGYFLLALAFGVPFLKQSGYTRRFSYSLIIGLVLLAYFPFLVTILIETRELTAPILPVNLFAYTIIHIGAAFMSIMMGVLLYVYPKRKVSWNRVPLILVFGMWAGISLVLVFSFIFPELFPFGEPITPVTVGSILTLLLLSLVIRWYRNPPINQVKFPNPVQILLALAGLIFTVIIGEVLNQIALSMNPDLIDSLFGSSIILGTNLLVMFAFAYIIFMLADDSKGQPPVELFVALFLVMWILPNILKSYYFTSTPGWWISEILLFVGLIAGLPVFMWLYVKSMVQVEVSHSRANMYADLLMHDVSNYNQMMMMSLELLGSEDISEEQRSRLAEDGKQVISFSEQLISNVRLLSEADMMEAGKLQPTSLVSTIVSALDIFTRRIGSGELVVEFKPKDSQAFVMANDLLVHIFLNILYSALECRKRGETVKIGIHETESDGDAFWQTDITAPGRSADQEDGYSSGTLGLLAAKMMTESLNGTFTMETFARTDICEGRLFSILLHKTSY